MDATMAKKAATGPKPETNNWVERSDRKLTFSMTSSTEDAFIRLCKLKGAKKSDTFAQLVKFVSERSSDFSQKK